MQSMQLVQMCVYTHSNMIYPRARPVDAYGPAAYGPAAYGCMVQLHMDQLHVPWGRRARLSARYVVVNCRALACFSSLCTSTLTHVIPDLRRTPTNYDPCHCRNGARAPATRAEVARARERERRASAERPGRAGAQQCAALAPAGPLAGHPPFSPAVARCGGGRGSHGLRGASPHTNKCRT